MVFVALSINGLSLANKESGSTVLCDDNAYLNLIPAER